MTATSERLTGRAEAERIVALCDSTRMLVEQTVKVLPLMKKGMFLCNIAQVIDNGKVTDHYALIPTAGIAGQKLLSLPAGERSLLTLLMVRLLCTVGKPRRIHETAVTLECEGISFSVKGKQIMDMGWKAMEKVYRNALRSAPVEETAAQELPPLNDQMTFLPVKTSIQKRFCQEESFKLRGYILTGSKFSHSMKVPPEKLSFFMQL